MARALGVKSAGVVYQWRINRVPADYCPKIEKLTGVPCEELRPDVDWGFVRSNPRPTTSQPQEA